MLPSCVSGLHVSAALSSTSNADFHILAVQGLRSERWLWVHEIRAQTHAEATPAIVIACNVTLKADNAFPQAVDQVGLVPAVQCIDVLQMLARFIAPRLHRRAAGILKGNV